MRSGSAPSAYATSTGTRSPKSVLKQSTPWASSASSFEAYQSRAAGLVKSTSAMPGCHRSHCHTLPSGFLSR